MYRPGENPANVHQIQLFAGDEEIENFFISRARRTNGKLTLEVEILYCEINREAERDILPDIHEQLEPAEERADLGQGEPETSKPGGSGTADNRYSLPLPSKRKRNRNNSLGGLSERRFGRRPHCRRFSTSAGEGSQCAIMAAILLILRVLIVLGVCPSHSGSSHLIAFLYKNCLRRVCKLNSKSIEFCIDS